MGWGEFFSLFSAFIWALAVILLRRSGETLPPFELNLFKNCLGLLLMSVTVFLFGGPGLPAYAPVDLMIVFASGVIGIALADYWYLQALNLMGASRTGIVASLFSPFVILLSAVFLSERMGSWQWLGFFMVISGVLLVTWRVNRSAVDSVDLKRGVAFGVLAMLMMAVGVVMVKDILETRPFLWTIEIRILGGVVGLLVYMLIRGHWKSVKQNFLQPQPWGTVIVASFLATYLSLIFWLAGYKLIDASVASVLNQTNSAFIIFLAWLMLGESVNRRKLTGMVLTLAGVLIMFLV